MNGNTNLAKACFTEPNQLRMMHGSKQKNSQNGNATTGPMEATPAAFPSHGKPPTHLRQRPRIMPKSGIATGRTNARSEEHKSELQSLMRNSYAVFGLKKKDKAKTTNTKERHYRA